MSGDRSGRIILCADDYGLSPAISDAIRVLATAERISATSCIVTQSRWMQDAAALKPLRGALAVGLHLNFTLGRPLSGSACLTSNGGFPTITRRILQTFLHRIDRAAVAIEIEHQLNVFEAGLGAPPDIIDGHEHVHVLPIIRQELLAILKRRYAGRPLLIRNPAPTLALCLRTASPRIKSAALLFLARNMGRDGGACGLTTNDCFGGVSRFVPTAKAVSEDFTQAAALDGWRPLVMCHPGFADASVTETDLLNARRQAEFDALISNPPQFPRLWRAQRLSNGTIDWSHPSLEQRS
jgi:chitin disaccharide deacetylase